MRKGATRLQFDFSGEEVKRLKQIGTAIEAVSNVETIRRSLRFYWYAIRKAKQGFSLEFVNEKEKMRITLPRDLF